MNDRFAETEELVNDLKHIATSSDLTQLLDTIKELVKECDGLKAKYLLHEAIENMSLIKRKREQNKIFGKIFSNSNRFIHEEINEANRFHAQVAQCKRADF